MLNSTYFKTNQDGKNKKKIYIYIYIVLQVFTIYYTLKTIK